ncbi:MAG: HU family DNA-binding protein [Nitrospirae bacterium]|nr:MAG: HU family DNA-binding protein [Nitrospirota bacterium]
MTKSELIRTLAQQHALPHKTVAALFDDLVALAAKHTKRDGFLIPGFGKITIAQRKARKARNPRTGETIKIPAKKVLKFKFFKATQARLTGAKA